MNSAMKSETGERRENSQRMSHFWRACLIGLASAIMATVLRLLLDLLAPDMLPYPFVFLAVLFATFASGATGGLVALVIGLGSADFLFVSPRYSFSPGDLTHILSLLATGLALAAGIWAGVRYRNYVQARDDERAQTERHLRLLMGELDHRTKNLLTLVQGIVRMTSARTVDVETFRANVAGRIEALARTHELLAGSRWQGAQVNGLVEEELRPYAQDDKARAWGPDMPLDLREAECLAMTLHELATNAVKYGALSVPSGQLVVTWSYGDGGERRMTWHEDGGPPVLPPTRQGLGTRLLERVLASVGGTVELVWHPTGLACTINLPAYGGGQDLSGQDLGQQSALSLARIPAPEFATSGRAGY
jgi:two-component sensor histidine kinase